jgi:hypothetical protein
MAEMKQPELAMPTAAAVVRENGDAVVEVRHDGALVGELNFSKIFRRWAEQLGFLKRPAPDLKSV